MRCLACSALLRVLPSSHAALTNRRPRRQPCFSTARRLITGSRSSLSAAYAEMVLFLNGNQDYFPIEVPALSSEQALQEVPRRLSNPTAEVEALSAGEAKDNDCDDEYEGESSSFT